MEVRNDIQTMKELLSGFNKVSKPIFWRDLILFSIIGWVSLLYTSYSHNLFTLLIGTFMLYRGTMLIHEVSHLSKKITGYRMAYNLLLGYANSYPAYIYDTHLFHHGKKTYATEKDPEYAFIAEYKFGYLVRPILTALLMPLLQIIRFGVMPLIIPFTPRSVKRFVYRKLSTLVFDTRYERKIINEQKNLNTMMINDFMCSLYKLVVGFLIYFDVIPFAFIYVWYASVVMATLLNMYRAIFNHYYANESTKSLSWEDHLTDTVTVEPGILTNIIFINGLNYHVIHHLFPEMPYHNLAAAHRHLIANVDDNHIYKKNICKHPFHIIKKCLAKDRLQTLSINNK